MMISYFLALDLELFREQMEKLTRLIKHFLNLTLLIPHLI
jgi:hypothetical protein